MNYAGVDPDSDVGKVYQAIYNRMAVECKAVFGEYLVPVPGLPSGLVGTSSINSLLMK